MPGLDERKHLNDNYTLKRWLLWIPSFLTLLIVADIAVTRYVAFLAMLEAQKKFISACGDNSDCNESGHLNEIAVCLCVVASGLIDSMTVLRAHRLLFPVLSTSQREAIDNPQSELEPFKARFKKALAAQGYDCSKDEICVHKKKDDGSIVFSVESAYASSCSSKKYIVLNVFPLSLNKWKTKEGKRDFAGLDGDFCFAHEAAHVVKGHTTPWKQPPTILLVATLSFLSQLPANIGVLVLNSVLTDIGVVHDNVVVNSHFDLVTKISMGMLAILVMGGVRNIDAYYGEHQADLEAVKQTATEYSDEDFMKLSNPGIKVSLCCHCLFKRPLYLVDDSEYCDVIEAARLEQGLLVDQGDRYDKAVKSESEPSEMSGVGIPAGGIV